VSTTLLRPGTFNFRYLSGKGGSSSVKDNKCVKNGEAKDARKDRFLSLAYHSFNDSRCGRCGESQLSSVRRY